MPSFADALMRAAAAAAIDAAARAVSRHDAALMLALCYFITRECRRCASQKSFSAAIAPLPCVFAIDARYVLRYVDMPLMPMMRCRYLRHAALCFERFRRACRDCHYIRCQNAARLTAP